MLDYNLIDQISSQSLKWIKANLLFFDVDRNEIESDDTKLKAFIELAYMLNMFYSNFKNSYYIKNIVDFILNKIEQHDFCAQILFDIDGLAGLAVLEEFELKYGKSKYNYELNKIVNSKIDIQLARAPFRMMDIKYSLEKAHIHSSLPDYQTLFKNTALGKEVDVSSISSMGAYSITHTIFYLTDMGRRKPPINYDYESLKKLLFSLIEFYSLKQDMDILSELIICINFLHYKLNPFMENYINYCFKLLKRKQHRNGSVPPFIYKRSHSPKQEFINCYHTTLVTLGVTQSVR
ncbi:DUF6895 family protein [Bombilactobacillus mellis]|uniref:DUF6895 family protein n=1 Tax=Bombilactobacillus mellis TaxID=1218508 RepID=UPI0015804E9D|nr:hypothetical protein [Bombilactobacillus mellis]NUF24867.1 hypothetical protein [Bombilactobacillus mellis]